MKEKNKNCRYCNKEMDAKTTRQIFCSDKCRIYWNRENVPKKTKVPQIQDLTESNKVIKPITDKPKQGNLSINADKPPKMEGESGIDYLIRVNEWKQNKK